MPDLSAEEFAELKADIQRRGVCVPIEKDEHGNVLDGHHRLRACEELGITDYPSLIRVGLSEDEKFEHALALNLERRHLSREQRRELHLKLKQQGWSNRKIAETTKVAEGTVRNDTSGAQNYAPATVEGKDGKSYPARRTFVSGISLLPVQTSSPAPHVANNAGDNEWYTPEPYIKAAREVMWVEAKHKTAFTWHRITESWQTGINASHWADYQKVAEATPFIPLWLLFLQRPGVAKDTPEGMRCPHGLYGQNAEVLATCVDHFSDRWGTCGMVYWREESLRLLTSYEDVTGTAIRDAVPA